MNSFHRLLRSGRSRSAPPAWRSSASSASCRSGPSSYPWNGCSCFPGAPPVGRVRPHGQPAPPEDWLGRRSRWPASTPTATSPGSSRPGSPPSRRRAPGACPAGRGLRGHRAGPGALRGAHHGRAAARHRQPGHHRQHLPLRRPLRHGHRDHPRLREPRRRPAAQAGFEVVSQGIAEALVTTALGLVVAIPAAWMFNYLSQWIERLGMEMASSSAELMDFFLEREGAAS